MPVVDCGVYGGPVLGLQWNVEYMEGLCWFCSGVDYRAPKGQVKSLSK